MIIDKSIIDNYVALQESIERLFSERKIEKKRFYTALSMAKTTFDRKLERKSFTHEELTQLADEINKTFSL